MHETADVRMARRQFLRFLAGSPLVALSGLPFAVQRRTAKPRQARAVPTPLGELITAPDQALSVMDFQPVARKNLFPAHYAYIETGVEGDATVRANREAYARYALRSRRLLDIRSIDTSIQLFGMSLPTPLLLMPAGSQRAFHPEGEIASATAAGKGGHKFVLSTVGTASIEEVSKAQGSPAWYQLYAPANWDNMMRMVKRVEKAGCPVLMLTVDGQSTDVRETLERAKRRDQHQCSMCHESASGGASREPLFSGSNRLKSAPGGPLSRKPMFDGIDMLKDAGPGFSVAPWDFVKRLRDATSMKLVLKGIVTREDAALAVENGVDGIVVSNHGGRVEETLRSTLDCLPEVVESAGGKIPILFDGGIRRGSDMFKALALGANAVGIGRPYLYGLGAFGEPGVEVVLAIMRREFRTVMAQAGATSIDKISRASLVDRFRMG